MSDETIGPDEFAKLLKISRAKFYRMKSQGKLPKHLQLGRLCRWLMAEVLAWLRAGIPPRDRWEEIKADWGFPNGNR